MIQRMVKMPLSAMLQSVIQVGRAAETYKSGYNSMRALLENYILELEE